MFTTAKYLKKLSMTHSMMTFSIMALKTMTFGIKTLIKNTLCKIHSYEL
jgi:hypothetical protein